MVPIKAHSTFKVTCPWDPTATFNLHVYSVIQLIASHTLYNYYLAAAVCVSCQELTSTLHEGNRTCQGEEVIFTCTLRGQSSVLAVAWNSIEYIGQGGSLQLSTVNMIGDNETRTDVNGNVTATATVTNIANVAGEHILETTLHITAVEASTVTCRDPNRGPASIEFTVLGTYIQFSIIIIVQFIILYMMTHLHACIAKH